MAAKRRGPKGPVKGSRGAKPAASRKPAGARRGSKAGARRPGPGKAPRLPKALLASIIARAEALLGARSRRTVDEIVRELDLEFPDAGGPAVLAQLVIPRLPDEGP